jgi:hypothetical protein
MKINLKEYEKNNRIPISQAKSGDIIRPDFNRYYFYIYVERREDHYWGLVLRNGGDNPYGYKGNKVGALVPITSNPDALIEVVDKLEVEE